jgi:hypothetical protein
MVLQEELAGVDPRSARTHPAITSRSNSQDRDVDVRHLAFKPPRRRRTQTSANSDIPPTVADMIEQRQNEHEDSSDDSSDL